MPGGTACISEYGEPPVMGAARPSHMSSHETSSDQSPAEVTLTAEGTEGSDGGGEGGAGGRGGDEGGEGGEGGEGSAGGDLTAATPLMSSIQVW